MIIRIVNVILFIGMIIMNYLANALPINNYTTGELSDAYPNLFVPAGLTFSIWGLIYLLLAVYTVIQFTGQSQITISKISWLFAVSCLLNSVWIIFWHYKNLPLSLLVMIGLLITLIFINLIIKNLPVAFIKASFGIYLGWICIATIANITTLLVNYGWNGGGIPEEAWAIIMIFAGAIIIAFASYRLNNPFISLTAVWAFAGIAIKRQDDYISIVISAIIALILLSILSVLLFFQKRIAWMD